MFSSDSTMTDIEEKTEIIYGEENIINFALERYSVLKKSLDLCLDSNGPSMMSIDYMAKTYEGLKDRGVQQRFITEITKDNIDYCKEFMKVCELRHLDKVKGNFGLGDRVHYIASARVRESAPPPLLISSSVRAFVEQQQYFFEMLWKKAIPARQRIKEIEENLKREFIETIKDSEETTTLVSKVLSSAIEEIQLIFSRANTLKRYEKLGMLDLVRKKAEKEVEVRVLIGTDRPIIERDVEWLREYSSIQLRYLNKSIQTSLTTIVTDRELSLVIEEKEEEDDVDMGLATYSNSESTVQSCASIFENLWAQSSSQSPAQKN